MLAFTIERFDSSLVSAILSAEYGIGVRDGKFCAHILVDELLEDPWGDTPATAVRVSVGLANTAEHVDRLVAAVAELAANGPRPALHPDRRGLGRRRRRARPGTPPPLVSPFQTRVVVGFGLPTRPKPVTTGVWKRERSDVGLTLLEHRGSIVVLSRFHR